MSEMNIKEATQIVDNPPPINWEWLAGFFQAEGSIGHRTIDRGYTYPYVALGLKDSDAVESIKAFIKAQTPECSVTTHNSNGYRQLHIFGMKGTRLFIAEIHPYTVGTKRGRIHEIADTYSLALQTTPKAFNWDFVTGFWEGDGTIGNHPRTGIYVTFIQKERIILDVIHEFIGKGSLVCRTPKSGYTKDIPLHYLKVYDSSKAPLITQTLLKHARTHPRRIQLITTLMESEHDL